MKLFKAWLMAAAVLLCGLPALAQEREVDAALRAAAERNDAPAFQALLARGADVNARDREGTSALQLAQRRGQAEVVRMLRAAGAR